MFLDIALVALIYLFIACLFTHCSYKWLNKKTIGGYWMAVTIGFLGAALGGFAFDPLLSRFSDFLDFLLVGFNWLMKNSDHEIMPPVNVVAAILGCFLFLFILRKVAPK